MTTPNRTQKELEMKTKVNNNNNNNDKEVIMTTPNRTQKELKMNTKIITKNPYGIKTPKSVKEFRRNLGKYFWTEGHPIKGGFGKRLYVLSESGKSDFIDIDKISSFSDIYELTNSGFGGDGTSPQVCPTFDRVVDFTDYMMDTNQYVSCDGYFDNEDNYKLFDNQYDQKDPCWYSLDNQITREFYMMTLGDFSGYRRRFSNV